MEMIPHKPLNTLRLDIMNFVFSHRFPKATASFRFIIMRKKGCIMKYQAIM